LFFIGVVIPLLTELNNCSIAGSIVAVWFSGTKMSLWQDTLAISSIGDAE
jgi:hypothetical protein